VLLVLAVLLLLTRESILQAAIWLIEGFIHKADCGNFYCGKTFVAHNAYQNVSKCCPDGTVLKAAPPFFLDHSASLYYLIAMVLFFALVGLLTCVCTGESPECCARGGRGGGGECNGMYCACDGGDCGGGGGGGGDCGEAGGVLVVLLVAVVVVFAIIGILEGVVFVSSERMLVLLVLVLLVLVLLVLVLLVLVLLVLVLVLLVLVLLVLVLTSLRSPMAAVYAAPPARAGEEAVCRSTKGFPAVHSYLPRDPCYSLFSCVRVQDDRGVRGARPEQGRAAADRAGPLRDGAGAGCWRCRRRRSLRAAGEGGDRAGQRRLRCGSGGRRRRQLAGAVGAADGAGQHGPVVK